MAKIITKPSALRREYVLLLKRIRRALIFAVIFVLTAIGGSVVMNIERMFGLGLVLLGVSAVGFIISIIVASMRHTDATVIKTGIVGENTTAHILSSLPKGYFVFLNLVIECDGKKSELDTVVVGPSGIYIVETKNRKGLIKGNYDSERWTQTKIGRGGTAYSTDFYSPVKQVGTHVFRLARYLRQNGAATHISGIVYFTGTQEIEITGREGQIPVISDSSQLKRCLMKQKANLEPDFISKICKLLSK